MLCSYCSCNLLRLLSFTWLSHNINRLMGPTVVSELLGIFLSYNLFLWLFQFWKLLDLTDPLLFYSVCEKGFFDLNLVSILGISRLSLIYFAVLVTFSQTFIVFFVISCFQVINLGISENPHDLPLSRVPRETPRIWGNQGYGLRNPFRFFKPLSWYHLLS